MPQVEEPASKLTIQDRVEDFSRKTFEQAEVKKVLIRNLKGLVHKVVRIQRKNMLRSATYVSSPLGLMQPGAVAWRRIDEEGWRYDEHIAYNECKLGEDFTSLVGVVIGYEVAETEHGGSAYVIVVAPNDRYEYRFDLAVSAFEVLDCFPGEAD